MIHTIKIEGILQHRVSLLVWTICFFFIILFFSYVLVFFYFRGVVWRLQGTAKAQLKPQRTVVGLKAASQFLYL